MNRAFVRAALLAGTVSCSKAAAPVVSDATPPPSSSNAGTGIATLHVDGTAYPVKSAVRVRRGDLTEEYLISSDAGGCELLQDKVTGTKQPRVRLSWTVAPDFVTETPHAVGAWALFVNEAGSAGHGGLTKRGPFLSGGTPDAAHGVSFRLAPIRPEWLPNTLSGSGTVTPVDCPRTDTTVPPISTLDVEVGNVRVPIRSVILEVQPSDTPGKLIRVLSLSSQPRDCDARETGEFLVMTSVLDETPGFMVMGRSLPDELDGANLGDERLTVKHGVISPAMKEVPVSIVGTAQLGRLPIKLAGQAVARICRTSMRPNPTRDY